ncbi:MAG: metallopeptidase family protein [Nocardioidaceae bacterium]|nr:metallopeptidase family protein [Nocardioidaceae bacterium]
MRARPARHRASAVRDRASIGERQDSPPPRRHDGTVLDVSRAEFERLVEEALDSVPAELSSLVRNVAVVVVDEAPADDPQLLGLYEGTPLTERDGWYGGVLPDTITIFRLPTLRMCRDADEVRDEVEITVVHEIAHHFGIDDERLHELGYD